MCRTGRCNERCGEDPDARRARQRAAYAARTALADADSPETYPSQDFTVPPDIGGLTVRSAHAAAAAAYDMASPEHIRATTIRLGAVIASRATTIAVEQIAEITDLLPGGSPCNEYGALRPNVLDDLTERATQLSRLLQPRAHSGDAEERVQKTEAALREYQHVARTISGIISGHDALTQKVNGAYADAYRQLLDALRNFGPDRHTKAPVHPDSDQRGIDAIADASAWLPTEWLEKLSDTPPLLVRMTSRGYVHHYDVVRTRLHVDITKQISLPIVSGNVPDGAILIDNQRWDVAENRTQLLSYVSSDADAEYARMSTVDIPPRQISWGRDGGSWALKALVDTFLRSSYLSSVSAVAATPEEHEALVDGILGVPEGRHPYRNGVNHIAKHNLYLALGVLANG